MNKKKIAFEGEDDCLFDEQEFCFWKDQSNEVYRWQRIKGSTPSGNTGPDGDHTSGKGTCLCKNLVFNYFKFNSSLPITKTNLFQ